MWRKTMASRTISILLIMLLATPAFAFAKKGKKYFKEGIRLETSERWDQAAEQFALAINEEPGNVEYVAHYRRALVKASLAFMDTGLTF